MPFQALCCKNTGDEDEDEKGMGNLRIEHNCGYLMIFFFLTEPTNGSNKSLKSNKVMPVNGVELPEMSSTEKVKALIQEHKVVSFIKSYCPYCMKVKELFQSKGIKVHYVELDKMGLEGDKYQSALADITGQRTVPNTFVNGKHLGGWDDTISANSSGKLDAMLQQQQEDSHSYDFDLVVIGGGSGGLSASKEATRLGMKVAVCDFVTPTPLGTSWGLGGTCVNVGCIPKKLMHQAALLGEYSKDSVAFGWSDPNTEAKLSWERLVQEVQNYIKSLNWNYKTTLKDKKIQYYNEYASFEDTHTLKLVNKKRQDSRITSKYFIIATGGRPRYPDIPGAKELGITSDDLFSLKESPGKTLIVGASYIALECAGFLHAIGIKTTVMVRSILLRGFDRQIAEKIGDYMEEEGIRFVYQCIPEKLERTDEDCIKVTGKYSDESAYGDIFNTVVFAVGRNAETAGLGLDKIGLKTNPKNGKVVHGDDESTNISNIYAIGDVLDGKPELTPVAIQAGLLLARRLCRVSTAKTDYQNIPTTVFTPLEYGSCGLSEDAALERHGEESIEVFHKNFWPLEWTVPKRAENTCYAKLIVRKSDDLVLGFHYLGPHAGEVTQGYAGMIGMGAKKADLDRLIGIHPTTAEIFTTLDITKASGTDPSAAGC